MGNIGILHPGAMGVSVAASAKNSGHTVYWASDGRSADSRKRAESIGLTEVGSVEEMGSLCDLILSVCPPHAAEDVAEGVLKTSFRGVFADLNAISPDRMMKISARLDTEGIVCVDGGIIGGPAWKSGTTWLYLSGKGAEEVRDSFSGGFLETEIISPEIGKASALKMCFAANTKGSTALITAVVSAAEALGVRSDLERQWTRHAPEFVAQTMKRISGVSQKAWRFAGEMNEIAATFESVGLPGGFHRAAFEMYDRIAEFKGSDPLPGAHEVIKRALEKSGDG